MNDYSALRREGKLCGTIKAAKEKRKARDNSQDMPRSLKGMDATTLIELGRDGRASVRDEAYRLHPRRKNWNAAASDRVSRGVDVNTNDEGRYSNRCTFKHYTYTPFIRCCGRCTGKHLIVFFGKERRRFKALAGWEFGEDEYGLFIVRTKHRHRTDFRYHFTSDDATSNRALVSAACEHEREQRVAKRERIARRKAEKAKLAETKRLQSVRESLTASGRVWVTFADARRAGNCAAGIRTFCMQHNLDPHKCYPLKIVQRLASQDNRVNRAIDVALDRAAADDLRGYCVIK